MKLSGQKIICDHIDLKLENLYLQFVCVSDREHSSALTLVNIMKHQLSTMCTDR